MTDDNPDAERSNVHHGDPQEDASAISAPTPPASLSSAEPAAPVSPSDETGPEETAPRPTPRPVPDNPNDPAEASSLAAPRPPAEAGRRPPAGTLLAKVFDVIERSQRPRRSWQIQRELGLRRSPSPELSRLVSLRFVERLKEGVYSIPGRDYAGVASAEGNNT
jgi:hypothetical protein